MGHVDLKRFETPDEVRVFEKGRLAVIKIGGMVLGRADVGPTVGAALCTVEHVGMVLAGTATVAFEDGTVIELTEGSAFHVPKVPHDSWVVGDRSYVSLHLMGADSYARR